MRFFTFFLIIVILVISFTFFYYYQQNYKPAIGRYNELVQENKTLTEYLNKLKEEIIKKDSILVTINTKQKDGTGPNQQNDIETRIPILSDDLFNSGGFELTKNGRGILKKLSQILLKNDDSEITIEGHTDNDKISSKWIKIIPSNWELSALRAINVLKFLKDSLNINENRLSAISFGSSRPVADNSTSEGKKENRRIEIVIKRVINIENKE